MPIEVVDRQKIAKQIQHKTHPFNAALIQVKRQARGTMGQVLWWLRMWSEGRCDLYCTKYKDMVNLRWVCRPSDGISFDVEHQVDIETMEQWWGKTIPFNKTVKLGCSFALQKNGGM